jgi:hypothetical protein
MAAFTFNLKHMVSVAVGALLFKFTLQDNVLPFKLKEYTFYI